MTNPYYNHGSYPAPNSAGASASMRAELDAITAGFNKLPGTLTANNIIFVNSSGTALEARSGIDGIVIGGTTPAAGTFTALTAATLALSSALTLPSGTVGAPGATFTGDTDNGWWRPAADTQAWSIAGAEALRLNATGFGIGVTPAVKLHVKTSSVNAVRFETTIARGSGQIVCELYDPTGQKAYFGYGSANDTLQVYQGLNQALAFFTNGTTRGSFLATGGLNIDAPSSGTALSVAGLTANNTVSLSSTGAAGALAIGWAAGISAGKWNIYAASTSPLVIGTQGAGSLSLATNNTEQVTINSSGNVGIGQSPTFRLDVAETSASNAVMRMVNLGTGAGAHASARIESAAAGGDAYTYYIRTSTYDWYAGLDATDNYYKIGTGSVVGTSTALVVTPSSLGVGVIPTSNIDVSVAGSTIRQRLRAGAGFAAILSICGNNTTAESTSFDLQQDSAGSADIVQRNNARLSLYTNNTERLQITAGGSINEASTSRELGYKVIPRAGNSGAGSYSTGNRGTAVAQTDSATMTIPNATFAAGDSFSIYNDSASSMTVAQGASLTLRLGGTTTTGNRTLAPRGFATVWFNSASEAIIQGSGLT